LLRWCGRGIGAEGAEEEQVGGVVAEGDAIFLEGEDDAAAEFAEDGVALHGAGAELDRVGEGAAFDLVDAEDVGVGDGDVFVGGVVAEVSGYLCEEGDDFVRVGAGVDGDVEGGDGVVAGEIGDGSDLAVGDDVESAVGIAEGGAAEGEVFYGAFQARDGDDLAYVVLVFYEDEDSVEHVLEDGLGAEADADADDAGGGEDGLVGDVEDIEELEEADESEDADGRRADDGGHGAELGGAVEVVSLLVGPCAHLPDEKENDPLEDKQNKEDDQDFWQSGLEKDDEVVMPVALDGLEDTFILREQGLEEHDYGVSLSKEDQGSECLRWLVRCNYCRRAGQRDCLRAGYWRSR